MIGGQLLGGRMTNEIYVLDTEKLHWRKPEVTGGQVFTARAHHTATVYNDTTIVIYGGDLGTETSDVDEALYPLATKTMTISRPTGFERPGPGTASWL